MCFTPPLLAQEEGRVLVFLSEACEMGHHHHRHHHHVMGDLELAF
jgi:hypothetical protein